MRNASIKKGLLRKALVYVHIIDNVLLLLLLLLRRLLLNLIIHNGDRAHFGMMAEKYDKCEKWHIEFIGRFVLENTVVLHFVHIIPNINK